MRARKARLPDANAIHGLIRSLSYDGTLFPRSSAEIYENIRDFTVVETDDGEFLGCGALHLYGPHLAEIRSIAVGEKTEGTRSRRLPGRSADSKRRKAIAFRASACLLVSLDFFSDSDLLRSIEPHCRIKFTRIVPIVRG